MGRTRKPIAVLMLTQDQCGFCAQAHDLLQRLAREYELSISEMDINAPEGQALALRGGLLFPPGIFLDGQPFSYGRPSEMKLRRELDRRAGVRPVAGATGNGERHVCHSTEGELA
jgi:hypothetical protein